MKVSIRHLLLAVAVTVAITRAAIPLQAQGLGWEGETGVFVTPLAYTAGVEGETVHPVVAYHYLNAGSVIGDFHEVSLTFGILSRFEIGYTHEFHTQGDDPRLSPLWQNGFEIVHGKGMLIPENYNKKNWVPAISVGFMFRQDVRNVGNLKFLPDGATRPSAESNGDVYLVASKTITQTKIPILLSGGVRGTDAVLWGMGGNAPNWEARAFGAVGFVFKGPAGSSIILASEASQQPHHPVNFGTLNIPTTLTYAARVIPSPKHHLNFDVGVAQIAGQASPEVNLKARHQFAAQMSWGF